MSDRIQTKHLTQTQQQQLTHLSVFKPEKQAPAWHVLLFSWLWLMIGSLRFKKTNRVLEQELAGGRQSVNDTWKENKPLLWQALLSTGEKHFVSVGSVSLHVPGQWASMHNPTTLELALIFNVINYTCAVCNMSDQNVGGNTANVNKGKWV